MPTTPAAAPAPADSSGVHYQLADNGNGVAAAWGAVGGAGRGAAGVAGGGAIGGGVPPSSNGAGGFAGGPVAPVELAVVAAVAGAAEAARVAGLAGRHRLHPLHPQPRRLKWRPRANLRPRFNQKAQMLDLI